MAYGGGFQQQFGSQSNAPPGASPDQFGGYGAGGYVPDGVPMSPGSPGVLSPPPKSASIAERQTVIPLTILQLLKANEPVGNEPFQIDGKEIVTLTLIGQIRTVEQHSTFFLYQLDDGTGSIDIKLWINDEDDEEMALEQRQGWQPGVYVRVIGRVSIFNHTKSVTAFNISTIKDFNELTFHNLEVIHTHAVHSREAQGLGVASQVQQPMQGQNYGMQQQQQGGGYGGQFGQGGGGGMDAQEYGGFTNVQRRVLQTFEADNSEEGCNIAVVFQKLSDITRSDISQAVEFLSGEGHLYSTIDDEHFKCTHE